jgi:hypothetical protein
MSGHKRATITISEDEYRRLHDAEMKLRFLPKKSSEPTVLNNQVHTAVLDHLDHVRTRQNDFFRLIETLGDEVRSMEQQTGIAIINQQAQFSQQVSSAVGSLWEQTEELLAEQSTRFNEIVFEEHQQRQSELLLMQQSLDRFEAGRNWKMELADHWIQAAEEMDRFICEHYYHQQFAPGEIERFERSLRQSIDNLADGIPEAALMQAQQVYAGLSELRLKLEKLENEWNSLYQAAWEGVFQMLDIANSCHTCTAHDLDGCELPEPVDIVFWSGGELDQVIERIENYGYRLQSDELSSTELLTMLKHDLPEAQQAVEGAVYKARLAVLNSQLRINIADLVIDALQKQGFVLQQAEYARDDQRMAYSARVRNLEGNEIVIQVNPSDCVGKNELHLVSLDREQRTEHELRQRSLEVTRSLGQYGLHVENLRSVGSERKRPESLPVQRTRLKHVHTPAG